MVKIDDDPARPRIFYSALSKWSNVSLFGAIIFLLFWTANGISFLVKGNLFDGLLMSGFGIFFLSSIVLGWRKWWHKWRGRVTTITIIDEKVRIEERQYDVIDVQKDLKVKEIKSVYIKRILGRNAGYEVRAKLHTQDDFTVLNLWSLREAKTIRQFLATQLHVPESWAPPNVLTAPY